MRIYLRLARGELAEIAVVVAPHLHVENFGLLVSRAGNKHVLEHVEDVLADSVQLSLDLLAVALDEFDVLAAFEFFAVLDGGDRSPRCPA